MPGRQNQYHLISLDLARSNVRLIELERDMLDKERLVVVLCAFMQRWQTYRLAPVLLLSKTGPTNALRLMMRVGGPPMIAMRDNREFASHM
jgi:hypothetical protein